MRIVYISGVWDLFHIGHLNALRRASELGDFLIAGVVMDEFATEYKGEQPAIPFIQRYAIVASIRYVDVVVPVTSFDIPPCEYDISIRACGPEYGKYPGQQVVLKKFHDMGIETPTVPRTPGISTTIIKERIINASKENCHCHNVTADFRSGMSAERFIDLCRHSIGRCHDDQVSVEANGGLSK
jgi:glycerol-3-phosphate cytidylyltransferase